MVGLAAAGADPNTIMIHATSLKALRTACSMCAKKVGRSTDRSDDRMPEQETHPIADADGRPMRFHMSAGQVSDHTGGGAPGWSAEGRMAAGGLRI